MTYDICLLQSGHWTATKTFLPATEKADLITYFL